MSAKHIWALCVMASFILVGAAGQQNPQWKGAIEEENGVKVIKNPNEPLYGEIRFELEEDLAIGNEVDDNYYFYKYIAFDVDIEGNIFIFDGANYRIQKFNKNGKYLKTIGRRGPGPGEFDWTFSVLTLDHHGNLYLKGRRTIQSFNNKGEFIKGLKLESSIYEYGVTGEGNILAKTTVYKPEERMHEIVLLNSKGEKIETFASLSIPRANLGVSVGYSHPYGQSLHICSAVEGFGIYGHSHEYKLFMVDDSGGIVCIIEKDESPQQITQKEKNMPIDELIQAAKKRGRKIPRGEIEKMSLLTEYRPFFKKIMNDGKGNIYVERVESILSKKKDTKYDFFNKDGYFLYKVVIPYERELPGITPSILIKNGYVYRGDIDKESHIFSIKRFKIKNWKQIKQTSKKLVGH